MIASYQILRKLFVFLVINAHQWAINVHELLFLNVHKYPFGVGLTREALFSTKRWF